MPGYSEALTAEMTRLGADKRTIFIGQAVAYPGTYMSDTLSGVPMDKRIELPVAEEMQMGMSLGLALQGYIPVSIYPRWNFLILATNQLVNHLDKIPLFSGYRPKVLIRVGVGSESPLDPGHQHVGDFTLAFRALLKTVHIERMKHPDEIRYAYREAMKREGSTILVEYADLYGR